MRRVLRIAWIILLGDLAFADNEARSLYDQAVKHYNLAEYDRAIELFKEAYSVQPVPSLLFNIAQSYRQKGPSACDFAKRFYESYLREQPETSERARVETLILEMDRCARESVHATVLPAQTVARERPPQELPGRKVRWRSWLGWSLTSVGVASAATGGALLFSVASGLDDCSPSCSPARTGDLRDRSYLGYGLVGAGSAMAIGGIVLLLLRGSVPAAGARATLVPYVGGLGVASSF